MASRVERKAKTPAPQGAGAVHGEAKDESLEILHPDREVAIAGRVLVVREFGFREGLHVQAVAKPFLDDLYARCSSGGAAPRFEDIEAVAAQHHELVVWMIAQAANVEPEWVAELGDADGFRLMDLWWMANAGFFIRRLYRALAIARAGANLPGGTVSTTRSSAPDTAAHPKTSDD